MKIQNTLCIMLLLVVILLNLSACNQKQVENNLNGTDSGTPLPTRVLASAFHRVSTPIFTNTSEAIKVSEFPRLTTPTPSKPASTATLVVSTPTPQQTWTPLPTMDQNQAQTLVLDLLENNAECELPCFFGITPGETSWEDAEHFLVSFADKIDLGTTSIKDGVEYSIIHYEIAFSLKRYSKPFRAWFWVSDGIVDKIQVFPPGTELGYPLDRVLTRYGTPNKVLLELLEDTPDGKPWFEFYIFYVDRGLTFIYGGEARFDGKVFRVCPNQTAPEMTLIPPGSQPFYRMEQDATGGVRIAPINQFPRNSIADFYETLRIPGSCIMFSLDETE